MAKARTSNPRSSSGGKEKPGKMAESKDTQEEARVSECPEAETLKTTPDASTTQPSEVESESETMEFEKGTFANLSELNRKLFSLDGAKAFAAIYIETSEKIAKDALDFQAKATEWAKDTPLAMVFEAQNSMARELVEFSSGTARRLWRIEEKRMT
jgi:hypothetical protein